MPKMFLSPKTCRFSHTHYLRLATPLVTNNVQNCCNILHVILPSNWLHLIKINDDYFGNCQKSSNVGKTPFGIVYGTEKMAAHTFQLQVISDI